MTMPNDINNKQSEGMLSERLLVISRIDGIDIPLALSRIGGKQSILEEAIEQTAYAMDEKIRRMETCLAANDLRGFSIEAHGLKNAFAGIGAMNLYALAAELDFASKAGDAPLCTERFPVFSVQAMALAATFQTAFMRKDAEKKHTGTSEMLAIAAGKASDLLMEYEADDALECLNDMSDQTFGGETDALLMQIRNKIKSFKYDEAIQLLKTLMA